MSKPGISKAGFNRINHCSGKKAERNLRYYSGRTKPYDMLEIIDRFVDASPDSV